MPTELPTPAWDPPRKPAELTEERLIQAILSGYYPIDSTLPGERELAVQLGVTRPTLRETLQRLASHGWVEIRHGHPTRVRNYWLEGNLTVLATLVEHSQNLPENFIPNLLVVRRLLAPAYARLAVENQPAALAELLSGMLDLPETPLAYSQNDWNLHHQLTILSNNPIFTMILNGFKELYAVMGQQYFNNPLARQHSKVFYQALLDCTNRRAGKDAEELTLRIMYESLDFWYQSTGDSHVAR